jgi:hypothetical protein
MPVLLAGLTALITGSMVHAGFGLWWLLENHLFRVNASYDWAGALAVSGPATAIVLVAGLLARRLAACNPPAAIAAAPVVPARVTVAADR